MKPCKPREIAFYEQTFAHHSDFAALIPTYFGTLSLTPFEQEQALFHGQHAGPVNALDQDASVAAQPTLVEIPQLLHGAKIATGLAIVLENLITGFVKPNILDVKLGAQLWDEDSQLSKRQRLDKIAAETTSGSLGFRVAGMRVWQDSSLPDEVSRRNGPTVYDKLYGRRLTIENVDDAFREFFFGSSNEAAKHDTAREVVLQMCEAVVGQVQATLEKKESRMVSSSLLIVFEGDNQALEQRVAAAERQQRKSQTGHDSRGYTSGKDGDTDDDDDDDDQYDEDDEEEEQSAICCVRMIDFAHASWTPGLGPDENTLQGVRSVRRILQSI